ncbi:MAG: S-layer homology domain-containing protein [Thermoleophilia bacterium]
MASFILVLLLFLPAAAAASTLTTDNTAIDPRMVSLAEDIRNHNSVDGDVFLPVVPPRGWSLASVADIHRLSSNYSWVTSNPYFFPAFAYDEEYCGYYVFWMDGHDHLIRQYVDILWDDDPDLTTTSVVLDGDPWSIFGRHGSRDGLVWFSGEAHNVTVEWSGNVEGEFGELVGFAATIGWWHADGGIDVSTAFRGLLPFSPIPNGYAFPNKGYKDAKAARAAWTHLFGPSLFDGEVNWWDALRGGFPMKSFAERLFADGVCYGMASSSLAAYKGELDPAAFAAGANTLWGLGNYGITSTSGSFSQLPADLKSTIEEHFTAQCAKVAYDAVVDNTFFQSNDSEYPCTMAEFIQSLRGALSTGPVLLCLWDTAFGHTVVAYRIDMNTSGTSGNIRIYDNNCPGEQCSVSFDLADSGSWQYPPLVKTPLALGWVSLDIVQQVLDAPAGTLDYHDGWVTASADATIRFVGAGGKVTGKVNGRYLLDNSLVRLDPVLSGGLGSHEEDRYAVQGSATRSFQLESEGAVPAWASGRGPDGSYILLVDGALDVAAAYGGTDVGFSGARAEEIRLAVEDGSTAAMAAFGPTLAATALGGVATGEGRVCLYGDSGMEVQTGSLSVDEFSLGTPGQLLTVTDVPNTCALRTELSDYDAKSGTLEVSLDRDGNGSFEATEEVPAQRRVSITFSDIASSPYKIAIESLAGAGIINGYQMGSTWEFRPGNPVLRAQFAKMAVLSLGLEVTEGGTPVPFKDVEKPGSSLYPDDYVAVAAANGLIQGYAGGYFKPYVEITRAQLLTIVVRMAERFKPGAISVPSSGWSGSLPGTDPTHGANIRKAEHSGLLSGINLLSFSIWGKATRGEVAQILWNLREK